MNNEKEASTTASLKNQVEELFEIKQERGDLLSDIPKCIQQAIAGLDQGIYRVATPAGPNNIWKVQEWVKKAILLYFHFSKCTTNFQTSSPACGQRSNQDLALSYDKVPLKFLNWTESDFKKKSLRVVPGAIVRYGSFLSSNVVLMNCFVNIGAYIGTSTMIDSFATVGSCAQIGARCHIAAGCVIGGVLEPICSSPVIVEDDCLIGANACLVEGIIVRQGATIAMGTRLGQSTKIIDRTTGKVFIGEVPPQATVVPGFYESQGVSISCGVIVGYKNRSLVNESLRVQKNQFEKDQDVL